MKFTLEIENEQYERINLTRSAYEYMVREPQGLDPPVATISSSAYATTNGSYVHNAVIQKRNIVLPIEMRGIGVEERRQRLYRVVQPTRNVKIYYRTRNISAYTEGYVETCTVNNFGQFVSGQVSIICPDPHWYSTTEKTVSTAESGEPTPSGDMDIRVNNEGGDIGFKVRIEVGSVLPPEGKIELWNMSDGWTYMTIRGTYEPGDVVEINTKVGQKSITLIRAGVQTNIVTWLDFGSTWLSLVAGVNALRFRGISNFVGIITHTDAYLGV